MSSRWARNEYSMNIWPDYYCQFDSYYKLDKANRMAQHLNSNGVPTLVYDDSLDLDSLRFPVFLVLIPMALVEEARRASSEHPPRSGTISGTPLTIAPSN